MSNIYYGEAPKRTYWYFGPHGYPMHRVLTRGWQHANLDTVEADGSTTWSNDDFPTMVEWAGLNTDTFLVDDDGTEFAVEHCRLVKVYEGFEPCDLTSPSDRALAAWPDDVIEACVKSASLRDCGGAINEGRWRLPQGFEDDTLKAVFERLVLGRIKDEIARCEALIKAHRDAHPDETELGEKREPSDGVET